MTAGCRVIFHTTRVRCKYAFLRFLFPSSRSISGQRHQDKGKRRQSFEYVWKRVGNLRKAMIDGEDLQVSTHAAQIVKISSAAGTNG